MISEEVLIPKVESDKFKADIDHLKMNILTHKIGRELKIK